MPQTGRPKTGTGHRDDAMLAVLDHLGKIGQYRRLEQAQYRERRDLLEALEADIIESSRSWRLGELVDEMTSAA